MVRYLPLVPKPWEVAEGTDRAGKEKGRALAEEQADIWREKSIHRGKVAIPYQGTT